MERLLKRKTLRSEILTIILSSLFVVTATLGYLSFHFSRERIVTMIGESLKGIAGTTATFISGDDITLIFKKESEIKEQYLAVRDWNTSALTGKASELAVRDEDLHQAILSYSKYLELLSNIKTLNGIESPINIYTRRDGRLTLILTSENALLTGVAYPMRPEAETALAANSPRSSGIYHDTSGSWISAYAPIAMRLPGDVEAVLEVNYKVDSYLRRLQEDLWVIMLVCLFGFAASAALTLKLTGTLSSSIKKLDESATLLEQERYDLPIDVRSSDEVGHLATTFETLRMSIRKKIEELRLSLVREQRAHLESIIALTNAIEMRDPYTRQHVFRVEQYALLIAKTLHLKRNEIHKLRYGCYLHDIGKIGIESDLLKKVKLSSEDFERVKEHSEKGAKILEGIHFLTEVKDMVLYHQERYDGKGYPKGLKGKEIPLMARIVTVADAFDAMTTDRPYKPKISFEEAMDNIEKLAGTQFDPEIALAFLKYRGSIERIAKKHFLKYGAIV